MLIMKIGVGQINAQVGAFDLNIAKIVQAACNLKKRGADIAVFAECAVSGYPIKDFAKYKSFVLAAENALMAAVKDFELPVLVGCPRLGKDGHVYNSAFFIRNNKVELVYDKRLLPNYGALNDPRVFESGNECAYIDFNGKKIAITICEDIWTLDEVKTAYRYSKHPLDEIEDCDLLINISASVFSQTNDNVRHCNGMLYNISKKINAPVLWCNLVGATDEIIFAGASTYIDANKNASVCLKKFGEDELVVDTNAITGFNSNNSDFSGVADIYSAIVMAIGDFVKKCGAKSVLLGLSGGIDSAVVAALAADALGSENVRGVALPSKFSSTGSVEDAQALAKNLGIKFDIVAIKEVVSSAENALANLFKGLPRDTTEENLQSRTRALLLMALSNKFSSLLLTTGNKSECAVGYCTLYGDTCGAYAPICDVYKCDVYALAKYINTLHGKEIIPQNTITKPPSAELRPDQKDSDSLPEYEVLDAILRLRIENFMSANEIMEKGYKKEVVLDVLNKLAKTQGKRSQYPLGPKLTSTAFLTDRKIPVSARGFFDE